MRTAVASIVVLIPALAACGTPRANGPVPAPGGSTGDVAAAPVRPFTPQVDPLDALPRDSRVARYTGPFAREPAVLQFQREAGALLDAAVARLREETGLQFVEGRAPRIVIVDAPEAAATGRTELRLTDGVRRPEIRIPAAALAASEFRTAEQLPALVAEAGVLASSPERAPPDWIVRGLPPVFAKSVDRRAAELVAGGARVVPTVVALAPLEPAFRVAALQRIGVGDRVISRFLETRLGGAGDGTALREVGVESMDFLEAAAATDANRALERATDDPRVAALRAVRAALATGDAARAEAALSQVSAADAATPWVDAEVRLVRAETSLLRDEPSPAVAALDDVLARPETVLRMRDARFLRALAALKAGDPSAPRRAAEFARLYLIDFRTPSVLSDLGVSMQDAFDLVSGDASVRARAAGRMGQSGKPSVAVYLAASLRDGEASVRKAVVEALSKLGGDDAVASIATATSDSDGGVRAAALTAFARADAERGLRRAKEQSGDPDPVARAAAAAIVAAAAPKPIVQRPDPRPAVAPTAPAERPAQRPPERAVERPVAPPAATPPATPPATAVERPVAKPPEPKAPTIPLAPPEPPKVRIYKAPPPPPAARIPRTPTTEPPPTAPSVPPPVPPPPAPRKAPPEDAPSKPPSPPPPAPPKK